MTADWEVALAIAEDRADEAERELAAIKWRAAVIRQIPWVGLFLDPVTSTTGEVCDALEQWAHTIHEVAGIEHPPPIAEMLGQVARARAAYA